MGVSLETWYLTLEKVSHYLSRTIANQEVLEVMHMFVSQYRCWLTHRCQGNSLFQRLICLATHLGLLFLLDVRQQFEICRQILHDIAE